MLDTSITFYLEDKLTHLGQTCVLNEDKLGKPPWRVSGTLWHLKFFHLVVVLNIYDHRTALWPWRIPDILYYAHHHLSPTFKKQRHKDKVSESVHPASCRAWVSSGTRPALMHSDDVSWCAEFSHNPLSLMQLRSMILEPQKKKKKKTKHKKNQSSPTPLQLSPTAVPSLKMTMIVITLLHVLKYKIRQGEWKQLNYLWLNIKPPACLLFNSLLPAM